MKIASIILLIIGIIHAIIVYLSGMDVIQLSNSGEPTAFLTTALALCGSAALHLLGEYEDR